jgi:hypothetical protein
MKIYLDSWETPIYPVIGEIKYSKVEDYLEAQYVPHYFRSAVKKLKDAKNNISKLSSDITG